MAFILSQKESYTWPVKYNAPDDGGRYRKVEFMAQFRHLPQSRLDELARLVKAGGTLDDNEFIDEVLLGWSGIKTSEGEAFDPNSRNRAILLDLPGMRAAVIHAFHESLDGIVRKN